MKYDPRKAGALCDSCPRRKQVPVPPEGPKKGAMYVWLGQDPGNQEVKHGRPFVGPTGSRTLHMWERACAAFKKDIPRTEILITNAALCMPITPSPTEARGAMTCCRPRLARELAAANPNAGILAMGKWAWFALTGQEKGVGKYLGFHVKVDRDEIATEASERAAVYATKAAAKTAKRKAKGEVDPDEDPF